MKHAPHRSPTTCRKRLFVCGTARSGTTALTRALNTHPRVAIGIERFKHRLLRRQDPTFDYDSLFDETRFFDHQPDDTNINLNYSYVNDYTRLRAKYGSAAYVGDKVPGLYRRLHFLQRTYPCCKVIVILRDPCAVARSWQARADNVDDRWSEGVDFRSAVEEWNRCLKLVDAGAAELGEDLIMVSYEGMFGTGSRSAVDRLFDDLGLDPEESKLEPFIERAHAVASDVRQITPEIKEHVAGEADFATYERLLYRSIGGRSGPDWRS